MSFLGGEAEVPRSRRSGVRFFFFPSKKTGTLILIRPSLLRMMVSLLLELGRNPSKPLRCKRSSAGM